MELGEAVMAQLAVVTLEARHERDAEGAVVVEEAEHLRLIVLASAGPALTATRSPGARDVERGKKNIRKCVAALWAV